MTKYLYGASIQGIQSFIFQTNKLREIMGASDLVDQLSNSFFIKFLKENNIVFKEENLILSAAGNIKYEFDTKEECQIFVRRFPKAVMIQAPGIHVSQAVERLDDPNQYGKALQNLEDKLRVQRNKMSYVLGDYTPFKIGETARRTGGLGFQYHKDEVLDLGQQKKRKQAESGESKLSEILTGKKSYQLPRDNTDLAIEWGNFTSKNNWLAIIHADGNGLGEVILSIYDKIKGPKLKEVIREFSKTLDIATKSAVKEAYSQIFEKEAKTEFYEPPIRPILIGGDDITLILKGDAAIPFVQIFLDKFEQITQKLFAELEITLQIQSENLELSKGLTACAGVCFVKPNFPFHYGVHLSDSLTTESKKHSKANKIEGKIPSSVLFHKVQSSYVDDYSSIADQTLNHGHIRFDNGPYFTNSIEGFSTLEELQSWIKSITRPSAPRSSLRQWLGVVTHDPNQAAFMLERIRQNLNERGNSKLISELKLENDYLIKRNGETYTHLYDTVNLSTI